MGWQKPLLFSLCLLPLGWLVGQAVGSDLGPDPAKSLVLFTGSWALNFLLLTLLVSPARQWLKRPGLIRYRRMLGLFAFFYASLHAFCVATYILGWDWGILQEELRERPYMLVGFLAWLTLVPLALTSNRFSVRRLGRRWGILHRLVYATLLLTLLHLFWLVRSDMAEALVYGVLGGVLLLWRWRNSRFFSRLDRKIFNK
ncbi:sulfoxide reductase heme-binding subunit YedZ [Litorivivens lipolytica]|uniref:Protein-methionine-sulfoxide reductase heme-binding subunit MsrQ n=1 Tax=Litorivivens lipolytica TaxID=1524264 RepID=A0A7W4W7I5_9GAMM|nr:protein-methionine-sulfoxide reductase heme-binding subunit MsrQ [Litorivivens lipolytica]MBB3048864.1 sulfoxide reductase heme-binding subunit YedZ [Litorivivens lipolytica]